MVSSTTSRHTEIFLTRLLTQPAVLALFAMLSNHYSFTWNHPQNWLVLTLTPSARWSGSGSSRAPRFRNCQLPQGQRRYQSATMPAARVDDFSKWPAR